MSAANEELREIARSIGIRAGELVLQRRREGVQVADTKSTLEDVVTEADREAEAYIRSALADVRPNDGFLGEESGAETGTSGVTWVVDPIDGTVNYLYGLPEYNVSIGAVEGDPEPSTWTALAGAVISPAIGEVFSASLGGGAFLGERRLEVGRKTDLSMALVGTGFSYSASRRQYQARILTELLGQVRDVRRAGAAALDLCSVAAGRLDAYYEQGLWPWDHAAGGLIATEAGAKVSGLGGTPAGHRMVLAANPELSAHLSDILATLVDDE